MKGLREGTFFIVGGGKGGRGGRGGWAGAFWVLTLPPGPAKEKHDHSQKMT